MSVAGTTPKLFLSLASHFGLKGEKYTREMRLVLKYEREPESKAARFRYHFVDAAGFRFSWDTEVDKDMKAGDEVTVTFRIASHSRKGQPCTRIKNCRIA